MTKINSKLKLSDPDSVSDEILPEYRLDYSKARFNRFADLVDKAAAMNVRLRPATPDDGAALWHVHTQAIRVTSPSHYDSAQIEAWAGRLRADYYQPDPEDGTFLVAEAEDGGIIGFGELNMAAGEIEAVFVSPEHGRCGVGGQILQALEDLARHRGLSAIVLDASLNAVEFYEKAGYRQTEATVQLYGKNAVAVPGVLMTKSLVV